MGPEIRMFGAGFDLPLPSSFTSGSCHRLADCAGHVVALRGGGDDVTMTSSARDRLLPVGVKPGPSSSTSSALQVQSSPAAPTAALRRRWLLEVRRQGILSLVRRDHPHLQRTGECLYVSKPD